jgi:hypothetical protein
MTGRRGKNILILASLVLAGIVLASWTQSWFTFEVGLAKPVVVEGTVAAPALTALALAELVLLLALAIAGRFFRVVLAVIQVFVGVAIIASAATSLADPVAASATSLTKATGIAGDASIAAEIVGPILVSAWPVVSLVAGVLLIVLAVVILVVCRTWPTSTSRKYTRTAPAAAERTAVDDWDSLSGGDDPTS